MSEKLLAKVRKISDIYKNSTKIVFPISDRLFYLLYKSTISRTKNSETTFLSAFTLCPFVALIQEVDAVAESSSGESERKGPPDADGTHVERKGEKVGKRDADEGIGDEGIEHHGPHTFDGAQGVSVGDLETVAELVACKGW